MSLVLLSLLTQLPIGLLHARDDAQERPQVLIIGDSISLGYTPFVIELLEGKATVLHHEGNAGPTQRGLENIEAWLGDKDWEVIHFNRALWDMYHWRYFDFDQSPAAYEENLETLVLRLKKTGAKLIWATTTPACPAPEMKQQVLVDAVTEQQYLEAAARVMGKHNVPVNDLHAFMARRRSIYAKADNDVHYTAEGYRKLAELVAAKIKTALNEQPSHVF